MCNFYICTIVNRNKKAFWHSMIMRIDLGKIFLALFIIGVIARVFTLAVLPESALVDSLYHISVAEKIAAEQAVPLVDRVVISPLYYVFSASLHIISNFPFEMPFVRILPVIITIIFFACAFLLFRKLFPKTYIIPLALSSIFPWLVRYGAVNYIDVLSAALLCFILYLFLEISEGKQSIKYAVISALAVSAFVLLKLNTIALWPIIFIAFLWLFAKNKNSRINAAAFAVIALALSGAWLVSAAMQGYGTEVTLKPGAVAAYTAEMGIAGIANSVFVSHLSFYDFPPPESFTYIPLLANLPVSALQIMFTIIMLPITIAILLGLWAMCKRRSAINIFILLLILAAVALMLLMSYAEPDRLRGGLMYIRYLIAAMPLFGIAFAYGLDSLKGKWKMIAIASFALFALYALAYAGISSMFYANVYEKHSGLFEFTKSLPEGSKIHSKENGKALVFYSNAQAGEIAGVYDMPAGEIYSELLEGKFTHIAVSCYRNEWKEGKINGLVQAGLVKEIYKDECASVYELEK